MSRNSFSLAVVVSLAVLLAFANIWAGLGIRSAEAGEAPFATPATLTFLSEPSATKCGSVVDLTVQVRDSAGNAVRSSQTVTFRTNLGIVVSNGSGSPLVASLILPPRTAG